MQACQKKTWDELVEQVRKGERAEEALSLREPLQNLGCEELRERLEVTGLVDTPLSFLVPSPEDLIEIIASPPKEEYAVLPPCLCLDTILHPEFALPPDDLLTELEGDEAAGIVVKQEIADKEGKKRKRQLSPEPPLSPEIIDDVIDLTQD